MDRGVPAQVFQISGTCPNCESVCSRIDYERSRHEHHLADIVAILKMAVGGWSFRKWKRTNDGHDFSLRLPRQDLAHPVADHVVPVPEMGEINAEDTAVVVH